MRELATLSVLFFLWSTGVYAIRSVEMQASVPTPLKSPVVEPQRLQTQKPPAKTSLPEGNLYNLSKVEQVLVTELVGTLLGYIDEETRYGCSEKGHPRHFPRQPKIAVTYKDGGFESNVWLDLRILARKKAPAVTLVQYNGNLNGAYLINILDVKATKPLATLTYRHSQRFSFGIQDDDRPRKPDQPIVTSEARFVLLGDWWADLVSFSKGAIHLRDRREMETLEIRDKPELLLAVKKGVEKFEQTTPERTVKLVSGDWFEKDKLGFEVYYYGSNQDPDIVLAKASTPRDLSGVIRYHILEKKGNEWHVLDDAMVMWGDVIEGPVFCREP